MVEFKWIAKESAQIYWTAEETKKECRYAYKWRAASYFSRNADISPLNQAGCDDDAKITHWQRERVN